MSEIITIDISKTGETQIKVDGVAGKSCNDITKSLEKALGKTTNDKKTQEFYQTPEVEQQRLGRQ